MIISKSVKIGRNELSIENGRVAQQADGSVIVRYGDTMVLVTAVASKEIKNDIDFLPLSVEYREKSYAAGKIPGGFIKREGRPSYNEVLSARLIDRPIRPLFPDYFRSEIQIIATVISMDKDNDADILAIVGASAALSISDIPFNEPIAAVRIGKIGEEFIVNPTFSEIDKSSLEIVVAGSADSIVMVEGGANEIVEEEMLSAIQLAHMEIKKIVQIQNEIIKEINKTKRELVSLEYPEDLMKRVDNECRPKIIEFIHIQEKSERKEAIREMVNNTVISLNEEFPESEYLILDIINKIEREEIRKMMFDKSIRLDGRKEDEIRPITIETGFLPRAHGSAIFTRGQTQALGTTTLGTKIDEQLIDALEGESYKSYMLHYNFPPFCTGEAKPIRGTSRREIGHGNLAERALKPVLPDENEFPYTIRVVSDILESNGSSSMATVCAGSLSLMDAGVPVKTSVAGIAMGLLKENEKIMILSDILGDEDHIGDMDFKVAGTRKGITAIQMDIKIKGIQYDLIARVIDQARKGRIQILDTMDRVLKEAKKELSPYAPRIEMIKIPIDKIGSVIGPGGKMIKQIIDKTGVKIDIDDLGNTIIASQDVEQVKNAMDFIKSIIKEPEVGDQYRGTVKRITNFGAFVEFSPGKEGMIHISEMDIKRTNRITDIINVGDPVDVIIKRIESDGKISLSRKEYLIRNAKKTQSNN
jgi:polyribonucleotide nucleotidyltransferase